METLSFRRWTLAFDAEATRRAYEAVEIPWSEYCGCVHCRNFARARAAIFPDEALRLLRTLGVDPGKELEVLPYRREDETSLLYAGWFHFVGGLVAGPDYWMPRREGGLVTNPEGNEALTETFRMGFTTHLTRVYRSFRGQDLVQLEFLAKAPWLLERRMPRWVP